MKAVNLRAYLERLEGDTTFRDTRVRIYKPSKQRFYLWHGSESTRDGTWVPSRMDAELDADKDPETCLVCDMRGQNMRALLKARILQPLETYQLRGSGTYGCVYSPPLPHQLDTDSSAASSMLLHLKSQGESGSSGSGSVGNSVEDAEGETRMLHGSSPWVSKLMTRRAAKSELQKFDELTLDGIDPECAFHLPRPLVGFMDTTAVFMANCGVKGMLDTVLSYPDGGPSLIKVVTSEDVTARHAPAILRGLARLGEGLQLFHAAGVHHMDVKADNILVPDTTNFESMRFIDWGLALRASRVPASRVRQLSHTSNAVYPGDVALIDGTDDQETLAHRGRQHRRNTYGMMVAQWMHRVCARRTQHTKHLPLATQAAYTACYKAHARSSLKDTARIVRSCDAYALALTVGVVMHPLDVQVPRALANVLADACHPCVHQRPSLQDLVAALRQGADDLTST